MSVNRIAKLLAWLYGSSRTSSGTVPEVTCQHTLRANAPAARCGALHANLTRKQRRQFATELKRIRAIRIQYPGIGAKVVGVQIANAQPSGILIQVSATRSARMSGDVDRLKRALAAEPALQGLRLLVFTRRPKRKGR